MNRFGLIGDVHAEDKLLEMALRHLATLDVDRILCVGDLVDGRGDVDRCVQFLRWHNVDSVRGNHDRWLLVDTTKIQTLFALAPTTRTYLATLPPTRRYETPVGPLLLCHGLGDDDMVFVEELLDGAPDEERLREERGRLQRLVPADVNLVVCGHSHVRGVMRVGRLTLINAGTLRYTDVPCFAVLDLDERAVQFYYLDDEGRVVRAERLPLPTTRTLSSAYEP